MVLICFARRLCAAFAETAQNMAAVKEEGDDCKEKKNAHEELDRNHIGWCPGLSSAQ